jgi:hypothetical protein
MLDLYYANVITYALYITEQSTGTESCKTQHSMYSVLIYYDQRVLTTIPRASAGVCIKAKHNHFPPCSSRHQGTARSITWCFSRTSPHVRSLLGNTSRPRFRAVLHQGRALAAARPRNRTVCMPSLRAHALATGPYALAP